MKWEILHAPTLIRGWSGTLDVAHQNVKAVRTLEAVEVLVSQVAKRPRGTEKAVAMSLKTIRAVT